MLRLKNPHTPPWPWLLMACLGLTALISAAFLPARCASTSPLPATAEQTDAPSDTEIAAATATVPATETGLPAATPEVPTPSPTPAPPTPSPTPTPPAVASLDDALVQGWVRGEIRGYDAISGDSVVVTLQRAITQEITVTIPQGALLLSASRTDPNMVARRLRGRLVDEDKVEPAGEIRLSDDRWQEYILEAYSLNFDRGQASPSATFLMVEVPLSEVSTVLAAADRAPEVTVESLQAAIWAITNGVDQSDLRREGVEPDMSVVRALFEAAGLDPTRKRLFDDTQVVSAQEYMARGNSYYDMGEYTQAIADYTGAIGLEGSGYVDAFYRRGSAAVQNQDYEQAIADFGEVIRLRPENPLGYYSRGIVQNAKTDPDYDAAIADLDKVIELDPKLSDAYQARGLVYAAKQDYERAIEDLTQAIQIDPGFVLAYHARGSVYSSMQDFTRAIADFGAVVGMQSDFAEAFRARGVAYADIGDPVLAVQDFQKYLALTPEAEDRQSVEELITTLQGNLPTPVPGGAIPLTEALGRGSVQITWQGLGVASGDSILLTVQRAISQEMEIGLPQGLVLVSEVASEGNMVVRRLHGVAVDNMQVQPAGIIHLSDDEPQRYFLEAYSLDFRKNDPGASTAFSLGASVDADTLRVLEAADRMPQAGRDILAIQAAIWVVRDDVTWEELIDRHCQPDLRVVRAILVSAGFDPQGRKLFGGSCVPAPAPTVQPTEPPASRIPATPTAMPRPTLPPVPPAVCPSSNVQITSPGNNQVWTGSIKVYGVATHPEFERYEVYFKSLDAPDQDSAWGHLATGYQPVQDSGYLMEWVTTTVHPNGAYRLRLRVVQRSGNYEDCVISVHIQN